MSNPDNPWRTLANSRVFEDDFIALDDDRVLNPAGHEAQYGVVRFKNRGLRILPIDEEGCTFLVGQWRYGAGYYSWELPAGNQEPDEAARDGAARELREEIGYDAEHWADLFEVVPSGSVTDQRERSFLAWGLSRAPLDKDEQERIRVKRVAFSEAVRMALAGEISDAGTVLGLLGAHVRALRAELPTELVETLGAA